MRVITLPVISIFLLAIFSASGCSSLKRNPVPVEDQGDARILGSDDLRAWAGTISPAFQADIMKSMQQEPPGQIPKLEDGRPIYHALAISGGGADGAFGAGFLNGWSSRGDRPAFKIVTGISTGALIAPFAFLGPAYDEQLAKLYTGINTKDIIKKQSYTSALSGEALVLTDPLATLIERYIDQTFIEEIARAHDLGRRLYIGTANLDAQHFIVWNMGLIAKSTHPDALQVFRDVLLASASIPVAFPPVYFEVDVNGSTYDEMHVDGGTATQVFFYAGVINLKAAANAIGLKGDPPYQGNLYVLRNGKLSSDPEQVPRKIFKITDRSINTMTRTAALGDLYRIYTFTRKEDISFKYVDIPNEYEDTSKEMFDQQAMKILFEVGYELGVSDDPWNKQPPGFRED